MKPEDCILFSGAANGAEAEFGAAAERRGIDEVNFSFGAGKVTIEGEGSFEKSMWKNTRKVRETRSYPVFSHTIPLDVAVDPEGAKAGFGGIGWTLAIPRKR